MRLLFFNILFLTCFTAFAQDKIFLLNGEMLTGKVTEIGPEIIKYKSDGDKLSVNQQEVLLIEFASGVLEIINRPQESSTYSPNGAENKRQSENTRKLEKNNLVSFNSLALCNSDVAVFYEMLFAKRQLGLGAMGAYNFNSSAGLMNNYIFVLGAARKNYDLGLTANFYFSDNGRGKRNYIGVLFKYTDISFSKVIVQPSQPNTINYAPAKGSQLSTIFTAGALRTITDNFYIKTIFGIGGFNLHGDYRYQYNYMANRDNRPGDPYLNRRFLPKLYFGLNACINF